jgi:hypothetical protein
MEEEKQKLLKDNLYFLDEDIKLQKEMIQEHGKVRERAIDYVYKIIQVVGLIAGFGFMAFSFVKTPLLWIIGQFVLFALIAYAIYWVRKTFIDEAGKYKKWIMDLGVIINERMEVMPDDFIDMIKNKMNKLKQKSINFSNGMKFLRTEDNNYGTTALKALWILFIIGGTMVLLSFLDLNYLLNIICK